MKILVTGGAGFIGSALVRHIIANTQHHVMTLDKLTYAADLKSLEAVLQHQRHQFVQADICDPKLLSQVFATFAPDAVMHLAAETHVDRSIDGPAAFIQTNIVGTYTLLEATRKYWEALDDNAKQQFRFLHVSTDEVFGDLGPSDELFHEQTAYVPSSPYSASKASADHLVRAWHRTYGLPVLLTNCSNNYGPWQFPEKLIPLFIGNALANKPLPLYGNGQQIRDWLYVDDHVRALLCVLDRGTVGETYLIGSSQPKQNVQVAKAVCDILNRNEKKTSAAFINFGQLITFVTDRPGHDVRYEIDVRKIRYQLGWQPLESFETGLQKTIDWYLSHQKWVQIRCSSTQSII